MPIYQSYIIRSSIVPLLFCLAVLTGMVWLSQVLRMLYLFEKHVGFFDFLELVILLLPSLIHVILPFAMLYSTLYIYNSMKINKELVVFENSGLSPRDLMIPIIKLGLIVSSIAIINGSIILPKTYGMLKSRVEFYKSNFASSIVQEGMFNNISKKIVLYVTKKTSDNKYEGLILFDSREVNSQSIVIADEGEMIFTDSAISFNLINGHRQSFNKSGSFEILSFDKFRININSQKSGGDRENYKDLQEHYIWELLLPDPNSNKSFTKLFAEGNNRLVWPMLNLILPLVAISVFLKSNFNRRDYMKHLVRSFFAALIFVLVHFVLHTLATGNHYLNILFYVNIAAGVLVYRWLTYTSFRAAP